MQKEVTKLLEEHKELIMESFNPIGEVFDEMNAQFNLMIHEVKNLLSEKRANADKGYTKQHVQQWVDWSKNSRVK
tara:strand:- start:407 stop:631 length:225 start_codon:yes stop_codon:yes gene_type:complete